jgi:hypothetical protein
MADTVTEEPEPPAEPAPDDKPKEPSFWASLHQDVRSLIVTITGTLIGGILVVAVVGGAIALERWAGSHPHAYIVRKENQELPVLYLVFGCSLLSAGTYAIAILARRSRRRWRITFQLLVNAVVFILMSILALVGLLALLILLGRAAGIK